MNIELMPDEDGDWGGTFLDIDGDPITIGALENRGCLGLHISARSALLNREMCAALWPLLKRYAESGSLKEPSREVPHGP